MEIVIRASAVFWILWIMLRAAGKRELAEMTPFELIVLVVVGDLIQQGVTEEDMSVVGAALAVVTILLWALALSYTSFKSPRLRGVLESRPTVVVADGQVDHAMLSVERLTIDDLLDAARNAGIERIADVRWAILEADGKISFIPAKPHTED